MTHADWWLQRITQLSWHVSMLEKNLEYCLTLTHIPGCPLGLYRTPLSLLGFNLLQIGMFKFQYRKERSPLTHITNRGVGLLQLRHWVNAGQNLWPNNKAKNNDNITTKFVFIKKEKKQIWNNSKVTVTKIIWKGRVAIREGTLNVISLLDTKWLKSIICFPRYVCHLKQLCL